MVDEHTMNLGDFRQRKMLARCQIMADLAKYPRSPLGGATDHDCIGPGVFEHVPGFLWRSDIAIGNDRNSYRSFYRGNGFVLRMSRIGAGAGASMNGQHLDTGTLGDAR